MFAAQLRIRASAASWLIAEMNRFGSFAALNDGEGLGRGRAPVRAGLRSGLWQIAMGCCAFVAIFISASPAHAQARVNITKISNNGTGTFAFTATNTTPGSATITTTASGGSGTSLASPLTVNSNGTDVMITEGASSGWTLGSIACTRNGSAISTTVDLPNRRVTIPNNLINNNTTFNCIFNNSLRQSDLSITKTNGQTSYFPGQTVSYTVTVANAGPAAANGALFKDAAVVGLSITGVSCGGETGGATCPAAASTTVALMQGTGIVIPTLPPSGSVTFTLAGRVAGNATGTLSNSASVEAPSTVVDTQTGNNTATDSDTPAGNSGMQCDASIYLTQTIFAPNTVLQRATMASNPIAFASQGQGAPSYNAAAFNPRNNYLYGISASVPNATGNHLVVVNGSGQVRVLGPLSGAAGVATANLVAGEIGPDGKMYLSGGAATRHFVLDLASANPLNATVVNWSLPAGTANVQTQDLAWVNGMLYVASNAAGNLLYSIHPTNGTVTAVGTGNTIAGAGLWGGVIGTANGQFYGFNNNGGMYAFDLVTGVATRIAGSPATVGNDAAHCVDAPITFAVDVSVTKTDGQTSYIPGQSVTYTVVASAAGAPFFGSPDTRVVDSPTDIPDGNISWTCSATTGSTCAAASGNGPVDQLVDLAAGGSAAFSITVQVPAAFTGNLVNTATVSVSAPQSDGNPSNNSATDTDTAAEADLAVTKTNNVDNVVSGSDTTYTIVVTNDGPNAVTGATVHDTPGTGLTCPASNAVQCSSSASPSACPIGPLTVADLQAGVVLGNLPATAGINTVTFTFSCAVQ